jgi:hypothetical protein
MPVKFEESYVREWLAENRPLFAIDEGWVYENANAPIPGSCLECGIDCAPRLRDIKNGKQGHCQSCAVRVAPEDVVAFAALHGHKAIEIYYAEVYAARGNEMTARIKLICPEGHLVDKRLCHFRAAMRSASPENGGCKECAKGGFDDDKVGWVYLLIREVSPFCRDNQIGITNNLQGRTHGYIQHGWTLVDTRKFKIGKDAREFEARVNKMIRSKNAHTSVPEDSYILKSTEAWRQGCGIPISDNLKALDLHLKIFEAQNK